MDLRQKWVLFAGMLGWAIIAQAEEGLWQPHQLPRLAQEPNFQNHPLQPLLAMTPAQSPLASVVNLGGCSGTFVSKDGLILTSRQCILSALQHMSVTGENILQQGFLAKSLAEELPMAPGFKAVLNLSEQNVSPQILQQVEPGALGRDRIEQIQWLRQDVEQQCEQSSKQHCEVQAFYNGLEFWLYQQQPLTDIRLVYVPAADIAEPNGLEGRWQWPHYSADVAILRAYQPADANEHASVMPYQPASFVQVDLAGVAAGESLLQAGFPQRSYRLSTAFELEMQFSRLLPLAQSYLAEMLAVLSQHFAEDPSQALRYQAIFQQFKARHSYHQGLLQQVMGSELLDQRLELEKRFRSWIMSNPARKARYLPVLKTQQKLQEQQALTIERDQFLRYFNSVQAITLARQLYRYAERAAPAAATPPSELAAEKARLIAQFKRSQTSFSAPVDVDLALAVFAQYAQLPESLRLPALDTVLGLQDGWHEETVKTKLSSWYQQSQLMSVGEQWLDMSTEQLLAQRDPLLQLAANLAETEAHLDTSRKELQGQLAANRPAMQAAWLTFQKSNKRLNYADANGTLRASTGRVEGLAVQDGIFFLPQSHLQGLRQLAHGQTPLATAATQFPMQPVNFLSSVDFAAGMSGAPTFNHQGQWVGMLIDSTASSMLGDYHYQASRQRAIHFDARYLAWLLTENTPAPELLQALSPTPATP